MALGYERELNLNDQPERLETSKRGYWGHKLEYLLACSGNVWGFTCWTRFPYLCYRYGGLPVFLVPYVVLMVHFAFPLMLLEMMLGRFL